MVERNDPSWLPRRAVTDPPQEIKSGESGISLLIGKLARFSLLAGTLGMAAYCLLELAPLPTSEYTRSEPRKIVAADDATTKERRPLKGETRLSPMPQAVRTERPSNNERAVENVVSDEPPLLPSPSESPTTRDGKPNAAARAAHPIHISSAKTTNIAPELPSDTPTHVAVERLPAITSETAAKADGSVRLTSVNSRGDNADPRRLGSGSSTGRYPLTSSRGPEAIEGSPRPLNGTLSDEDAELPQPIPDFPDPPATQSKDWWLRIVRGPQFPDTQHAFISLDSLIPLALQNSRRIEVARLQPFVERENATQADARFDWNLFARQLWTDTNRATGATFLNSSGGARLLSDDLSVEGGARRTNSLGGNFEAKQSMRLFNSNQAYPPQQGLTEMTLRYTQPLLRDGGYLVNYGQVLLAQQGADSTAAQSEAEISKLLLAVVDAYWAIYQARVEYIIQTRLVERNANLLITLERRRAVDADTSLLAQVEASLATHKAELETIRVRVRNAQHRLVRATGDRSLGEVGELIPLDPPTSNPLPWDETASFQTALQNRAELRAAMTKIRSSQLRADIAEQQLLPNLALILEANANGLNSNYNLPRSYIDQYRMGLPTYMVGFSVDYPVGNRAAQSRARQAQLQISQETAQFQDTVDQIRQEVYDAKAKLDGAARQMEIRRVAIEQNAREITALQRRRTIFPDESDRITQLFVREVLDAQTRLANSERELLQSYITYSLGIIELRQATGTLYSTSNPSAQAPVRPNQPDSNLGPIPAPAATNAAPPGAAPGPGSGVPFVPRPPDATQRYPLNRPDAGSPAASPSPAPQFAAPLQAAEAPRQSPPSAPANSPTTSGRYPLPGAMQR